MEGIIINFPKFIFFVDGNKNKRRRPKDNVKQKLDYDGYKKYHACSITSFTDIYRRFICSKILHVGLESDKTMYVMSDVYQNLERFLSNG